MGSNIQNKIDHVVVLMLENRSFDNLLGWLYPQEKHHPNIIIPKPTQGCKPYAFNGLDGADFSNPVDLTNPENTVPVKKGVKNFVVPTPDPNEDFKYMNRQQFGLNIDTGTTGWLPPQGKTPTPSMQGFLADYVSVCKGKVKTAKQIMQTYTPQDLTVLSNLAWHYAVSDNYHASCPTQTWPNRAFMHAGTSLGHVNNMPYLPYDCTTIFNVLEEANVSWNVYKSSWILPSLTRIQMTKLWHQSLDIHFHHISTFIEDCENGTLPAYSFLEPRFVVEGKSIASSQHPPTNVCFGDHFLAQIWKAIAESPVFERILFIVNFDEHGGCPDHVPPNWTAVSPDKKSSPGHEGFCFDRYGVRVPCIVASAYTEAGTIFRASEDPWSHKSIPYDHTSILAMILDWRNIDRSKLPSKRVQSQPDHPFDELLALDVEKARKDRPQYTAQCSLPEVGYWDKFILWVEKLFGYGPELVSLQKSIVVADAHMRAAAHNHGARKATSLQDEIKGLLREIKTEADIVNHFSDVYH